ncbi:hypothetical protein Q8W71_29230 [Methylobacterium sp. NEAU 140]|uniref:hypothetical protein n=1 Tax=Methylobacterium sp. NEAU 140 TaxID=3064945 RepID=UPI002732ED10|nr:hypothetical protein [Methylobacterium sp. NEAU 140]MDP4026694.1 hypothetical protein [Methylobacterium sp. NEAU 140]
MANILSFPTTRRSSCTISPYRAYRFAPNGSIRSTLLIEAETDAEAERRTLALADGHRIELWSRARFVAHIQPMGGQVAVSLTSPHVE